MTRIFSSLAVCLLLFGLSACSKTISNENIEATSNSSASPNIKVEQQAEQLYSSQPPVMPALANAGEYKVGVKTLSISNPQQLSAVDFTTKADRQLTVELWYPAKINNGAKLATYSDQTRSGQSFTLQGSSYRDAKVLDGDIAYPLIVMSHGYTGYRSIMFYLGEHLASHGYVVASIDHTDSTNADIDFSTAPFAGFMSTLLNRARDQQYVLDYFGELQTPFAKNIDTDRASVIGYSMGGYGAINTVGGCYNFSKEGLMQFGMPEETIPSLLKVFNTCNAGRAEVDTRWKAMLVMAPWGGETNVHSAESLAELSLPVFYIGGEHDDIVGYEKGVKKLFEQTGSAQSEHTYMMVYENARHNFATHPAPKVAYDTELDIGHYYEPAWNSETLNRVNQHMSLAFLDCHVKAKADACEYLPKREDIAQVKQADGSLTEPWLGFQNRWGTGVKFYRKGQ